MWEVSYVGVIRWGLIGAGDIVRKRVAAALRDAPASSLVAISRARAEHAEEFAQHVGARRSYPKWQDLLSDREVDAVYVATPVYLHAEQTIAAARAGKHVLCEKPMAMSAAECDAMIAACAANHVKLGVAYYRHFYPAIGRIKQILATGEIGRVVMTQMSAFERFDPAPGHPRHWFVEAARSGGGPMMDFGCHRLEVLLDLLGPVRNVTGTTATVVCDREVEDTAIATLRFVSGSCATVTVTHAALEPQDSLHVFATDGSIHIEQLNSGVMRIITPLAERQEAHAPAANLHAPLVNDFIEAVRSGRQPAVTGEIGRMVADLEDKIYQRVRSA